MNPTKHPDPAAPARRRFGPILRLVLLLGLFGAVCALQLRRPVFWVATPPRPDSATEPTISAADSAPKDTFVLRHLFHHGAGSAQHRVHRRLDVTPAYLAKTGLDSVAQAVAENAPAADLESVYAQNDWPQALAGANPWTLPLTIRQKPQKNDAYRLKHRHTPGFIDSYLDYARQVRGNPRVLNRIGLEWQLEQTPVPDVADKDTLVNLALISSNAYVRFPEDDDEKKKSDWYDVAEPWRPDANNSDVEFGWDAEGVRGHVFVNDHDKIVVIGIKGTSGAGIPGSGSEETTKADQLNDNLLFSCCCARVSYLWTTVCDCFEKAYTCNQDCLERELVRRDRYYQAVLDIYRNVSAIYTDQNYDVWLTGHSLGGSLASLLGRTYGVPVVAFEAPGELLATKRLHLPQPPGIPKYMENIWHIGNTADPIFMGVCNGVSSTCNAAGYAMETACHTGKICVYDVVTDKGWSVNVLNHRIHTVIDEIILKYNDTAECVEQPPCRDCFNWRFVAHDEDEADEPVLPNPLRPRTSSTSHTATRPRSTATKSTATSTGSDAATSTASDPPQKCLKRTWYGWCKKWDENPEAQNGKA